MGKKERPKRAHSPKFDQSTEKKGRNKAGVNQRRGVGRGFVGVG